LSGSRFALAAVALAVLLTGGVPARANGVISEMPAGGLVFKKTDTIGIASEDLYVSIKEVRVGYVYVSTAVNTQNVTVSFPMPIVELDGGPLSEYLFGGEQKGDLRNYMKFAVTVNGRPVGTRLREIATLAGKDVTQRLKAAGLPPLFENKGQEAVRRVPRSVKDALIADGFFDKPTGDPPVYTANWKYQVLFEWEQSFPPGPTRVDIRYRPIIGDGQDYGDFYEGPAAVERNCVDDVFRAALKRGRGASKLGDRLTLGYVLKTARYWNGPIGKFRLVVDKEKPDHLVAFCPLQAKKISPTQFEWTATNFVPDRDVEVVFFTTPR
jgi:Domain of unknown function (DUF4424)